MIEDWQIGAVASSRCGTGEFMSLSSAPHIVLLAADESHSETAPLPGRRVMAATAWHSLLWLVLANCVGVLLAAMLLFPGINALLGEWTYGRWMAVHMNLQLYGWCSLP